MLLIPRYRHRPARKHDILVQGVWRDYHDVVRVFEGGSELTIGLRVVKAGKPCSFGVAKTSLSQCANLEVPNHRLCGKNMGRINTEFVKQSESVCYLQLFLPPFLRQHSSLFYHSSFIDIDFIMYIRSLIPYVSPQAVRTHRAH